MDTASYPAVGYIPMPEMFRYRELFEHGRPQHGQYDPFRIRHPEMDHRHRAKIFAPFNALEGFDDAIASKEDMYAMKRQLSETEQEKVNTRLVQLRELTFNGPASRKNRPQASITYFVPCQDKNSFAYSFQGTYNTITGTVEKADEDGVVIDGIRIPLEDISKIS